MTDTMREDRAKEIADELSNTQKWHSHGRGISKEVLERDLNLKIKDFGATAEVNAAIRNFYGLLSDFATKMRYPTFLYTPNRLVVPIWF